MKSLLAIFFLVASMSAAQAQEWVIGAGYADFSSDVSDDQGLVSLEYHHTPFYSRGRLDVGFAGAATVHTNGDLFAGAGLAGIYALNNNWFVEASVLPGAFFEKVAENDLGSTFEIRSLLGVGYTFQSGDRLSVALTHKSNASTANRNPGVNAVLVRLRRQF